MKLPLLLLAFSFCTSQLIQASRPESATKHKRSIFYRSTLEFIYHDTDPVKPLQEQFFQVGGISDDVDHNEDSANLFATNHVISNIPQIENSLSPNAYQHIKANHIMLPAYTEKWHNFHNNNGKKFPRHRKPIPKVRRRKLVEYIETFPQLLPAALPLFFRMVPPKPWKSYKFFKPLIRPRFRRSISSFLENLIDNYSCLQPKNAATKKLYTKIPITNNSAVWVHRKHLEEKNVKISEREGMAFHPFKLNYKKKPNAKCTSITFSPNNTAEELQILLPNLEKNTTWFPNIPEIKFLRLFTMAGIAFGPKLERDYRYRTLEEVRLWKTEENERTFLAYLDRLRKVSQRRNAKAGGLLMPHFEKTYAFRLYLIPPKEDFVNILKWTETLTLPYYMKQFKFPPSNTMEENKYKHKIKGGSSKNKNGKIMNKKFKKHKSAYGSHNASNEDAKPLLVNEIFTLPKTSMNEHGKNITKPDISKEMNPPKVLRMRRTAAVNNKQYYEYTVVPEAVPLTDVLQHLDPPKRLRTRRSTFTTPLIKGIPLASNFVIPQGHFRLNKTAFHQKHLNFKPQKFKINKRSLFSNPIFEFAFNRADRSKPFSQRFFEGSRSSLVQYAINLPTKTSALRPPKTKFAGNFRTYNGTLVKKIRLNYGVAFYVKPFKNKMFDGSMQKIYWASNQPQKQVVSINYIDPVNLRPQNSQIRLPKVGPSKSFQIRKRSKRSVRTLFKNPIFNSVFNHFDQSKLLQQKFFEGHNKGDIGRCNEHKNVPHLYDLFQPFDEYGKLKKYRPFETYVNPSFYEVEYDLPHLEKTNLFAYPHNNYGVPKFKKQIPKKPKVTLNYGVPVYLKQTIFLPKFDGFQNLQLPTVSKSNIFHKVNTGKINDLLISKTPKPSVGQTVIYSYFLKQNQIKKPNNRVSSVLKQQVPQQNKNVPFQRKEQDKISHSSFGIDVRREPNKHTSSFFGTDYQVPKEHSLSVPKKTKFRTFFNRNVQLNENKFHAVGQQNFSQLYETKVPIFSPSGFKPNNQVSMSNMSTRISKVEHQVPRETKYRKFNSNFLSIYQIPNQNVSASFNKSWKVSFLDLPKDTKFPGVFQNNKKVLQKQLLLPKPHLSYSFTTVSESPVLASQILKSIVYDVTDHNMLDISTLVSKIGNRVPKEMKYVEFKKRVKIIPMNIFQKL